MDPDISLLSRNRKRRQALVYFKDEKETSREPELQTGRKKEADKSGDIRFEDPRAKYFREIQTYYHQKKAKALDGLAFEDRKITVKEKRLRNLSPDLASVWRKLQNKTLFFSCLRTSIRNSRFFGMAVTRVASPEESNSCDERTDSSWLVGASGLLFGFASVVSFVVMLVLVLIYPLDLALSVMDDGRALAVIAGFAYFFAAVDVGLNFLKPFIDQRGVPVTDHSSIALLYLKSWLVVDVLSCVPLYFVLGGHRQQAVHQMQASQFSLCILVIRYLKIVFSRCHGGPNLILRKLTDLFSSGKSLVLMKTLAVTFVIIHICSCSWIIISKMSESDNWYTQR